MCIDLKLSLDFQKVSPPHQINFVYSERLPLPYVRVQHMSSFVQKYFVYLGMAKVIGNEFEFGDIVYLKTDSEQRQRIVFKMIVYPNEILYELACGTTTSVHYTFEISKEVNVLMQTTN